MADVFWHRPLPMDKRWHAYTQGGNSLCGAWALAGIGKPKDARARKPKAGRCGECVKRESWQKYMRQMHAERVKQENRRQPGNARIRRADGTAKE